MASPPPIIFLDIDGVLNDVAFLDKRDVSGPRVWDGTWSDMINPAAVARLNRILDATGAHVVISSSWRIARTNEQILETLRGHGFTGRIVGRTDSLGARFMEIRMYAAHHRLERWIAIDDGNMSELGERMVLTSWARGGLLDEHVEQACAKLGGAHQERERKEPTR